ncbi:MAG: insulinase family protein [Bacteroidales bacterium]|nr:insulinase family protein [Bacteroidales bacterium]
MKYLSVSLISILTTYLVWSQNFDENQLVPIDKEIKYGKLDNGLVYYIKRNLKPEKRIELRLAVNAGSILETDEQQGLAHFCEHMCFNGTKNFPKNELINVIERMGIKFGPDLNAYTSFDETVYMLKVPTDQPDLIEKGFQILEEWAHLVTFDGKEIEKERGVILEEWRLGLGAEDRMRKKAFPIIFKGSKYAERIPIGKPEIIKNFKHETLINFYKDWYRPDLMAVVVVGDIDVSYAEEKIKKHFSAIKNPPNPKKRETFDIPDNKEPLISIQSDPEATSSTVSIMIKHPKKNIQYIGDYKNYFITQLVTEMINARLDEIEKSPECPYIMSGVYYGNFLARTKDAFTAYAMAKENQIENSLEILLTEIERARRYGFTQGEIDRKKSDILKDYEIRAKEYDKTESANIAMKCVYHYLAKNPIPSAQDEYDYAKYFIPQITLDDVNTKIKEFIKEDNIIVMITAPQKENIKIPTETDVLSIFEKVKKSEIKAYEDKNIDKPFINETLTPANIISTIKNEQFGITEYTLSNNVKVIVKPTDFKNNEIQFSSFGLGGISLASDEDVLNAMYAPSIVDEMGLSEFSQTDIKKKLSGKDIQIYPFADELKQGVKGKCAPADLETTMQLIYLYYTKPRKSEDEFKSFISKTKNQFKFLRNNPRFSFVEKFYKLVTQNNPRKIIIPTDEQLEKVTIDKVLSFYNSVFGNANDVKFFFVGNIKEEEFLPLAQKYLGNLPSSQEKLIWRDVSPTFPSGIVNETVYKGIEEQGFVGIAFKSKFEWTYENQIKANMMFQILQIMLRENIREKEGGTYGVQVQGQIDKYPKPELQLYVIFGCEPKKQDKLSSIVFKQISLLQKKGPSEDNLNKVKEQLKREFEVNMKENKWWLSRLENSYFLDFKLINQDEYNKLINSVTADEIKNYAIKYINLNNYVKVYLKPEKSQKNEK